MSNYSLVIKPSVEKDLKRLPKTIILRVLKQIIALQDNPTIPQSVKLSGMASMYRVRVGDYRIIYEIEEQRIIIHYVRHRGVVYRTLN